METVKCPKCGSEEICRLTDEKYVCLACDSVFLVRYLLKESQQMEESESGEHLESERDISRASGKEISDEEEMLEKAESHMESGNYREAYDFFTKVTTKYSQCSAGWYGRYRALTEDFSQIERYACFVCGGNYIDLEDEEEGIVFDGNMDVRNALSCSDADAEEIKKEVVQFLKECTEYGKQDIEISIWELIREFQEARRRRFDKRMLAEKRKKQDQLKALRPMLRIGALLFLAVVYFLAAGDWLGKTSLI